MLRKALDGDRTRTHVVEISPLGLVEMTRQNVSEGVREIMNKTCPTCDGEGVVRSEETIAIDVERRLRKLAKKSRAEAFLVQVHPRVAAILIGGGGKPLRELEQETGKLLPLPGHGRHPARHVRDHSPRARREEIEDRALPFKQGEEVLIRIEEPHMYNVDDAIAKIDGYVISISGGGPFVGESKLIKIDEVKRTAAYASIVTSNGVPGRRPRATSDGRRGRAAEAARTPEPERRRGAPTARRRTAASQATIERLHGQDAAVAAEAAGGVRALGAAAPAARRQAYVMAYAIIEMGGKQYRVEEGDSVLVDRVRRGRGREGHARAPCSTRTARRR